MSIVETFVAFQDALIELRRVVLKQLAKDLFWLYKFVRRRL